MNTQDKYHEAVKTIAQDMTEVIDINDDELIEEYLMVLNDGVLNELTEQATA